MEKRKREDVGSDGHALAMRKGTKPVTGYGLNRELQKLNHKWLFLYYMEICPGTLIVNVLFISSMQFLYLENRIKCRLARRRI